MQRTVYPESVIIDIPEPISFEVDIAITEGTSHRKFINADSVFSRSVVQGFTESLRKIRLFVPEDLKEAAADLAAELF